jgi:Tfp pilus assembly protein PilN
MRRAPRHLGARIEACFRPKVHWGAEFLADRVRICGLREDGGKSGRAAVAVAATFEGPYAEAEAFARAHGLAYAGLHGAVSHLPFKIEALEPGQGEDDILPQVERFKPIGLTAEALDAQAFAADPGRHLLLVREDALRGFLDHLPAALASLRDLVPSPLALFPQAAPPEVHRSAALLVEEGFTHILFLREGAPEAYAKAFTGREEARRDPAAFAREMKKVLIYHHGSRFPGASLDAIVLWSDGAEAEAEAALGDIGPPHVPSAWSPDLAAVPAPFRVAGSMALAGLRETETLVSFTVPRPVLAEERRLWMRRAGMLARTGYQVAAAMAVIACLLMAGALGFRLVVESKARTWAGELGKWDSFQKRRAAVESQLGSLQGVLSRRTGGYASLQGIAAQLPAEVWLQEWEAEAGPDGRYVHRLTGYSLAEDKVPRFLANLEGSRRFGNVKLKSTERIQGEKVEKETGIAANRKDLVRFQMVVAE